MEPDEGTVVLSGVEPVRNTPSALFFEYAKVTVVNLDLRGVDFVCPLDLVALAAWATALPAGSRGSDRTRTENTESPISADLRDLRPGLLRVYRPGQMNVRVASGKRQEAGAYD